MIVSLTQNGADTQTGREGNCLDLTKGAHGRAPRRPASALPEIGTSKSWSTAPQEPLLAQSRERGSDACMSAFTAADSEGRPRTHGRLVGRRARSTCRRFKVIGGREREAGAQRGTEDKHCVAPLL